LAARLAFPPCDSPPGQHARAHFTQTGHPLIEPMAGKPWNIDDTYVTR
jgi:hypothetical protein